MTWLDKFMEVKLVFGQLPIGFCNENLKRLMLLKVSVIGVFIQRASFGFNPALLAGSLASLKMPTEGDLQPTIDVQITPKIKPLPMS